MTIYKSHLVYLKRIQSWFLEEFGMKVSRQEAMAFAIYTVTTLSEPEAPTHPRWRIRREKNEMVAIPKVRKEISERFDSIYHSVCAVFYDDKALLLSSIIRHRAQSLPRQSGVSSSPPLPRLLALGPEAYVGPGSPTLRGIDLKNLRSAYQA
jgi:hypothetical protein